MLIYEYLPHELARLGVVAKAAGLDRRQVAVQVRLAQERVGSARMLPAVRHHLSEPLIAELRRLQWKRIAHLMDEERIVVYSRSLDPRAVRYEEQRLQRLMHDVAQAERSGVAAPEISRQRVYRITTRPTGHGSGSDLLPLTVHLMAASADEAAVQARAGNGRDGDSFQRGRYRIASVVQALPEPGEIF
ncbi:hypothetical protein ACIQ8D_36140 [Streptomyces sp. NPDC096094]|uniref:hypothetical protein n=1 Tax=Streptomyces sp. NPDC096094 TaxID=3366073 RepID=UPI0037F88431